MSESTVQFVELVRNAVAKQQAKPLHGYEMYCELCNSYTLHTFKQTEHTEIYTCQVCGRGQEFKVR